MDRNGKKIIKKSLSQILCRTGVAGFLLRNYRPNKSFILMYHRIKPDKSTQDFYFNSGLIVEEKTFDFQMKYLKENFEVVPLQDLVNFLKEGKENIFGKCSVTIDDGWRDNFDCGFPILLKYRIPATIFLTARYINSSKWFWQDKLYFLINRIIEKGYFSQLRAGCPDPIFSEFRFLGKHGKSFRSLIEQFLEKVKEFPCRRRDSLIDHLSRLAHASPPDNDSHRFFLNWEEIRQMHSKGISFGAHGVGHELLTRLPKGEIEEEIAESKRVIEENLGFRVEGFCYPNGDYNSEIIAILKKNGFRYACTTQSGFNDPETDLFQLKRMAIHNDISCTVPLFVCRICGLM